MPFLSNKTLSPYISSTIYGRPHTPLHNGIPLYDFAPSFIQTIEPT